MRILHAEDDPNDAELIRRLLLAEWPTCEVHCVADRAAFTRALGDGAYDVILSDFGLPDFDGFDALRVAKEHAPNAPFIFVSGTIGEERAIEAIRLGAEDYVLKDRMKRLVTAITRATRDAANLAARKRLEEQFLRAQRMENLGLLAAGIAHDLNNTLAPILLGTPMLRDHVHESSALRLLDTLEKSAERGSMLVRQILSFAHGVGGEHHLLQVKHLLRDITEVILGTFPKSIRLEDYVPSDLWPINGNPTQIHQVLLNLCVNARDAMPGGGVLRLRGENRVLGPEDAAAVPGGREGAFLVIHVSDTGTGIAPEIMSRIWEPFFTTKDAGRGTGLGLSTVRGIVEAHHGFVEARSRPGQGATFEAYLPAAEIGLAECDQLALQTAPRGNGELILVVDDEQQIREITSAVLRQYGYRVILASDGVEAAAVFAQRAAEIRLVVSDLHMPNLDGAMLGRALRRINPGMRMLLVSGMAAGLDNQPGCRHEEFSDGLLLKPFKPEALLEHVRRLLGDCMAAAEATCS